MSLHKLSLFVALGALGLPLTGHAAPTIKMPPSSTRKKITLPTSRKSQPSPGRVTRVHAFTAIKPPPPVRKSNHALAKTLPAGTALATAALLTYVDRDGKGRTDRRIRKALDRIPGGRAAAERLAKAIRALPKPQLTKALGGHAGRIEGPTSVKDLRKTMGKALNAGFSHANSLYPVATVLSPENLTYPSHLDLDFTGVRTTATSDSDGEDEIFVLTKVYDDTLELQYEAAIPETGTLAAAANATLPQTQTIPGTQGVLVTAMGEADGDAEQLRADTEVAIELARSLAKDMGGNNLTTSFEAALTYTEGMLAMSKGTAAPSLRARYLTYSDLTSMWSSDPENVDGVDYKTTVEHSAGGGSYTLLYDVPSVMPPMRNVQVDVSKIQTVGVQIRSDQWIGVSVDIEGESADKDLMKGKSAVDPFFRVVRGVVSNPIDVSVEATLYTAVPFERWDDVRKVCGMPGSKKVEDFKKIGFEYIGECKPLSYALDLNPADGMWKLSLLYDPDTGAVEISYPYGTETVRRARGGGMSFTGDASGPKGKANVQLRIKILD